jgi:ComF family protein
MFSLTELFDFFLPRSCVSCEKHLTAEEKYFCTVCFNLLNYADDDFIQSEFDRKFSGDNLISSLNSLFIFDAKSPVRHIIHHLKYNKRFKAGLFLGELIAEKLKADIPDHSIDIFIPVPLHHTKEAERGFNQAYVLTRGINKYYNKPVYKNLLKRIRYTRSQTRLSIEERVENLLGAFVLTGKKEIENKKIAIVDDVITTGSTINECAKVLKQNGAKKIIAISAAITKI